MENETINKTSLFLEECLNNRSQIINSPEFKIFLSEYSKLADQNAFEVSVKVKPNGEPCNVCHRYISGVNLQNSVKVDQNRFLCSLKCLRIYKEMPKRKSTV